MTEIFSAPLLHHDVAGWTTSAISGTKEMEAAAAIIAAAIAAAAAAAAAGSQQSEGLNALPQSDLRKVKALDLNNEPESDLIGCVGKFVNLILLRLGGCQLTAFPDVTRLISLTHLVIDNNQLTRVPAELGRLGLLEQLHLNNNQLTSIPAELGRLGSLKILLLDNNRLTSVPAELGRLGSLEQLSLQNNRLTSIPAEFGNLESLETLHLFSNRLTSLPAEIENLGSLETLGLHNNPQLSKVPQALGRLQRRGVQLSYDGAYVTIGADSNNSYRIGDYL